MSLNIDKEGFPLAYVKGGKNDKIKIYISDKPITDKDNKLKKEFKSIGITDGIFQQIPNTVKKEREIGVCIGKSGSGKSHYTKNYCVEYKKQHKNNPIYMFSHLTEDKTLDSLDLKRVILDEDLVSDPYDVSEFENSLVLFDDVDVISDKKIKEAVYNIMNQILETGRHYNVSCIMTNHLATAPNLKRILNECNWYCYFPQGSTRSVHYVLEAYLNVDKLMIKKIRATHSRWAVITNNYPQACITEKAIFLLGDDE
jgi:hypothetical protein